MGWVGYTTGIWEKKNKFEMFVASTLSEETMAKCCCTWQDTVDSDI
jgi:hypothetical protein